MTKKMTSMFSRLAAKFLKPAFAILAVLAVGGAWATTYSTSQDFTETVTETGWTDVTGGTEATPVVFSATDETKGLTVSSGNLGLSSGYWQISSGTYNITDSLFGTAGVMNFAGNYLNVSKYFQIGGATVNVTGGTIYTGRGTADDANPRCGAITVAQWDDNNAALNISGGNVYSYGAGTNSDGIDYWMGLVIASGANSVGEVTVSDWGRYDNANDTKIASGSSSQGTLTVKDNGYFWNWTMEVAPSGQGFVNAANNATLHVNGTITAGMGGTGTVNVSDSATFEVANFLVLGQAGTGNLNVTGGTVTIGNDLQLATGEGATATATISGGSVSSTWDTLVGRGANSTASLTVSGTASVEVGRTLVLAWDTGSTGTLNLNGGTFKCNYIDAGTGTATININGGTLVKDDSDDTYSPRTQAATGTDRFIADATSVVVGSNGGTIDTNGRSITTGASFTGTGTLRIIGGGSVNFTVAPTCTVVADADTTVTGAGNVASTEAVSIVAPSADWASKTLPTTAGIKTVASGNWATYADGGDAYKQTLGSDTAYVSLINLGDSNNGATIAGVSDMGSATANEDYSNVSMDVYTVLKSGSLADVVGGYSIVGPYYCIVKGNLLTSIQGGAPGNVSGAGAIESHGTGYVVSRVDGNTGVVIEGNAKVQGSVAGGFYLHTKDNVYGQTTSGARLNKVNGAGANTSVLVKNVQDENSATALTGEGYVISGACIDDTRNMYALVSGNSSVKVDIEDGTSGSFNKTIVGGPVRPFNNKSGSAPKVNGNSSVEISAPSTVSFNKPIIGGAYAYRAYAQVDGNSSVTINGGTFTSTICAGANYHGLSGTQYSGAVESCSVGGDATLTINGGSFTSAFLSGGVASGIKTLAFTGNADISSCMIDSGTGAFDKITINKGVTVTISASQASMFTAQGLSVEENAGVYTATYVERYYWTPGTTNANWDNPENWRVGDDRATTETAPGNADFVEFPADGAPWTVTLTSAPTVAVVIADGNVTFSGAQIYTSSVTGTGTITLAGNAGFHGYDYVGAALSITANLTVTGTGNRLTMYGKGSGTGYGGGNLSFTGDMTGNGEISIEGIRSEFTFTGNWQTFSGTVNVVDNGNTLHRNGTRIDATKSSSALAKWNVYNADNRCFVANGSTYEFGELTGVVRQNTNSSKGKSTIKVGTLGTSFALTYIGNKDNAGRRDTIIKTGTGTMTLDATFVDNYQIEGGCLLLTTDESLPTVGGIVFKEDGTMLGLGDSVTADASSKISVDSGVSFAISNATAHTFATAIGSGTTGGFTKKGAGALTLAAPPTYTGTTKVEAGVLYVINGDYTLTLDSSTAEVTTDKDGYRKFVPASVTIDAPVVVWGNDFETATISAAATSNYGEGGLTYNLKIGDNVVDGAVGKVNNGVVTFSDVDVSGLSISPYGNISVEVTASAGGSQAATSGTTTAMLAESEEWVAEKKSTTGTTGSWKTADGAAAAVTYGDDDRVQLSDNKFSANNCSTGDVVTVTFKDVVYTALSDTSEAVGDAQGSIALGGTESAPKFLVLTKSGTEVQWSDAAGVDPALNTSYTIVFTFDYNNDTYSITVNGTALTVGGSATYGIVKTDNKYVKDIDFLGSGSIKAIEGVQYDAKMAVDQDGVRYATVAEALNANKGVKGAVIKLLHGTANTNIAGWSYNADTMTFIKKAMGLIFLAF